MLIGAPVAGQGRGLPGMEVPAPPIWKTPACLTLLPVRASPALI